MVYYGFYLPRAQSLHSNTYRFCRIRLLEQVSGASCCQRTRDRFLDLDGRSTIARTLLNLLAV